MKKIVLGLYFLAFFQISLSQNKDDSCYEVLLFASKDISTEYSKANTAKYLYDKYCEGNSLRDGVSISVEDNDLLSSAGLNFGSAKESVRNVCSTYISDYKSTVEKDKKSSRVVRESISAWLECKRLSNQGIKINPNLQSTQFSIDFARIGDDITINGVDYDKSKCKCQAVVNVNGETKLASVDESTQHTITDGGYWNLRCKRIPKQIEGEEIYDELDFLVATNKGTFSLNLARSSKPNYVWINDIMEEVITLKDSIENLSSEIFNVNSRFGKISFERKCIRVQDDCTGVNFGKIQPSEGYMDVGLYYIDSWPGGKCGQGTKCRFFVKIEK